MSNQKYNIIYADPAWTYLDPKGTKGAAAKYDLMSTEDIKNLPVKDISADDCVLFMWAVMPQLQEALDVMKAWGFTYKTCGFTWVKKTKNNKWFFGMGNYTRSNAELCLIGTKGKIKRKRGNISSVICTKIQEHSKKPDIVREKIVDLFGNLPRIELFARQVPKGWHVWGNDSEINMWEEYSIKKKKNNLKKFLI